MAPPPFSRLLGVSLDNEGDAWRVVCRYEAAECGVDLTVHYFDTLEEATDYVRRAQ